jgi:protein-tyrosine phosphatase
MRATKAVPTSVAQRGSLTVRSWAVSWQLGHGVVEFPDGVRVRGRGLKRQDSPHPQPEWGLYLLARSPAENDWPGRWVRWLDFWLPSDEDDARLAFEEVHRRAAAGARVEVACGGGKGRTGTALACIAQLSGVAAGDATAWVRARYDAHAVETPWQRRYVRRFIE